MKADTRFGRSLALGAVAAAALAMMAGAATMPVAQARAGALGSLSSPR